MSSAPVCQQCVSSASQLPSRARLTSTRRALRGLAKLVESLRGANQPTGTRPVRNSRNSYNRLRVHPRFAAVGRVPPIKCEPIKRAHSLIKRPDLGQENSRTHARRTHLPRLGSLRFGFGATRYHWTGLDWDSLVLFPENPSITHLQSPSSTFHLFHVTFSADVTLILTLPFSSMLHRLVPFPQIQICSDIGFISYPPSDCQTVR